jgi:hypothetical protein
MIRKISFSFFLLLVLSCGAQQTAAQKNDVYLFSYFKGNGEDGLHLACSSDGLKWTSLKNDQSFLTPVTGKDKLMRDPCLFKGPDGTFHLVWTVSWNEQGIGYASSKDLINWSEQKYIPVMEHEAGARNCWAPEITYDPESKLFMIYWATTIPGRFKEGESGKENSYNHRMYYITTKDFKSFSKTALLYDHGFNVIDATIALDGKRFVMFLKDETPEPPQKNIRVAFSDKLSGPYSQPSKPITGNYWAEGPTSMMINGYRYVFFDKYRDRKYGAVRSKDLQAWEDVSELVSFPEGVRHGTILKVTEKFLQSLKNGNNISDLAGFQDAINNGKLVNEGFNRCINYVNGWIKYADPATGLIPRNLTDSKDYWNAWDAAADNYPFMVLTSSILMPEFFRKTALNMLNTEKAITPRIGKLPDTYSFSKKGFRNDVIDTSQIIFGSAEYMKDGLIPLTEWLGQSPWSDRMLEILNDVPRLVRVVKQLKGSFYGNSAVVEVNGDLLQVLARMYWFTGKREYLEWGAEIADYYLNDERLPTIGLDRLRIRDHGCEIISGLCEVYLAAYFVWPEKYTQWKKPIHKMLDRILEVGRNEDGLFYNEINPKTGEVISNGLSDTFGYTLNAFYFVSKTDSVRAYWDAVIIALNSLNMKYRNYNWENGGCDGYADAIEGTLNLFNREPLPSVKEWLDSEIKVMWNYQKPDGIIEGWHGDGNFARTTIMYCLWKTQGILPVQWNEKLSVGATFNNNELKVAVSCGSTWIGKIRFDSPRYEDKMHLPVDYPRINQYQQWFTVYPGMKYLVSFVQTGRSQIFEGKDMIDGLPVSVKPGETFLLNISEVKTGKLFQ